MGKKVRDFCVCLLSFPFLPFRLLTIHHLIGPGRVCVLVDFLSKKEYKLLLRCRSDNGKEQDRERHNRNVTGNCSVKE